MKNRIAIVILSLFLVLSLVMLYIAHFNNNIENRIKTDTITILKVDTITMVKPVEKYKYIKEVIADTLYNKDSIKVEVNIPIETQVYGDSTFKAVI